MSPPEAPSVAGSSAFCVDSGNLSSLSCVLREVLGSMFVYALLVSILGYQEFLILDIAVSRSLWTIRTVFWAGLALGSDTGLKFKTQGHQTM